MVPEINSELNEVEQFATYLLSNTISKETKIISLTLSLV